MFVAFFWFYSKPILNALPKIVNDHYGKEVPHLKEVCEFLHDYNDAVTVSLYVFGMPLTVFPY